MVPTEAVEDERPSASDGVRFIGETDDEEAEPESSRVSARGPVVAMNGRDEGRGEARGEGRKRATMAMVKTVAWPPRRPPSGRRGGDVADGARNAQTIAARSEPWPMGPDH